MSQSEVKVLEVSKNQADPIDPWPVRPVPAVERAFRRIAEYRRRLDDDSSPKWVEG